MVSPVPADAGRSVSIRYGDEIRTLTVSESGEVASS